MKFALRDMANSASPQFASVTGVSSRRSRRATRPRPTRRLRSCSRRICTRKRFANFGKFQYHRQWGTTAEQLRDLEGAIAGEDKASYLPKESFAVAVYAKFRLEVMTSDYGQALRTWEVLETHRDARDAQGSRRPGPAGFARPNRAPSPFASNVAIGSRHSRGRYAVRNRFSIAVNSGAVVEIKLRCAEQYLFFKYQPDIMYSIGSRADRCLIEVIGDERTMFDLMQ